MKKIPLVIFILLLMSGCNISSFGSQTVIDWIDFIKWDGKDYVGIHSGVLAEKKYIGKKIGEVKFKVADNVQNSNYRTKDGDAAFHEKGTALYRVKGDGDLLAVKAEGEINGYRIYSTNRSEEDMSWHFKNISLEKVEFIEIYQRVDTNINKISELSDPGAVKQFFQILKAGEENPNFQPDMTNGDPINYEVAIYTGNPVAFKNNLYFDGTTYYWHPWEISILSDEIGIFLPEK